MTNASVNPQSSQINAVASLQAEIDKITDPQVKQFLTGVNNRTKGDLEQIKAELAQWFDSAMDRVSGTYKRYTQLISFFVELAISVVTNVDSIRIARGMWEQPTISQRLTIPPEGQNVGPNGDTSAEAKEAEAILKVLIRA